MRTLRIALAALVMLLLPGFLRAQTLVGGQGYPRSRVDLPQIYTRSEVVTDSLVVTWEAQPGDQGYHLELTGVGDGEAVELPAGVTRYAWPLRLTQHHAPSPEALTLTACLERVVVVQLVRPEEGWRHAGCAETTYALPQPPPPLRLEIRRPR